MSHKTLIKNASWLTLVSGIERAAALLQTVLIARALGVTEYGVYGLVFGTIGLASSIAGLQMGLTATVFLARYRDKDKARAAYVIAFVTRFALTIGLVFLAATLPFAAPIAHWLIGPTGPPLAIVAGCLLVAFAIMSGVQDGILQGFEDFRTTALVRTATTLLTLAATYPAGVMFGLIGPMAAILGGIMVKYIILLYKVRWHVRRHGLPAQGAGLHARELLWGFSVPSMLVSLLVGAVGWLGTFILSRQPHGFSAVALTNTGLQWRGPILLLTTAVSRVAIPAISRLFHNNDHGEIRRIHRTMVLFNGGAALLAVLTFAVASPFILAIYGSGFEAGAFVSSIIVVSALPQVIANIYLQHMVAKGQMWQQLILYLWLIVPLVLGYLLLIPRYHSQGFAFSYLLSWSILALALFLKEEKLFSRKPS